MAARTWRGTVAHLVRADFDGAVEPVERPGVTQQRPVAVPPDVGHDLRDAPGGGGVADPFRRQQARDGAAVLRLDDAQHGPRRRSC
jgi:hypothetical protein